MLVVAVLVAAGGISGAFAKPRQLVTIDGPGIWTLERLGYGDQVFTVEGPARTAARRVSYRLPRGAAQGRGTWYLIRLHFRISFAKQTGTGLVYVTASSGAVNDRGTSAQIRFEVRRDRKGILITSDSLGLVEGNVVRTSRSLTREIVFANYMPYRGIRPGVNVLSFGLDEQLGRAKVTSLRIYRDSGIEVARSSPANVFMRAQVVPGIVREREDFALQVTVRNAGQRRSKMGSVTVDYPRAALALQGKQVRRLPSLKGGQQLRMTFEFTALRPGRYPLGVSARSALSHPYTVRRVRVLGQASQADDSRWWLWTLIGLLPVLAGIAGTAVLVERRKRR